MTIIKKVIEYVSHLWYYLNNRGMGVIKMKKMDVGIMDARTLACYIMDYYKKNNYTNEISPLKLQKALYFCFAYWGGFIRKNNDFSDSTKEITFNYSEILFDNRIEAWVYGPVVPDVYHEKNIDNYRKEDIFDGKFYIQEFINNVLDDVLSTNDFRLVEVSHNDKCWKRNFKPKSKYHNFEIPPEEIIAEYAKNYQ